MKSSYRFFVNGLIALFVASVSIPVALRSADSAFGMASMLVVPTFFVALVFTITARDAYRRIFWFVFTCSAAIWMLFLSQILESAVLATAIYLQDLTQQGTISLSQRVIEPVSLGLIFLGPPVGAALSGVVAGRLLQYWFRRRNGSQAYEGNSRWRFSIRELLVAVFALSLLLAVAFGRIRNHQAAENSARSTFLARFEASFTTHEIELLQAPIIVGGHRALVPESGYRSFMAPDVNEYRIVAPISKDNKERWAVWSYTCNGQHDDMVYQFAYAEAPTEDQLPPSPFPMKTYINQLSWRMIDGVPK
ncbi:MAG TPA: hypothetical protein VGK58_19285 [Lacipirellulaceae bacterium]